MTRVAIVMGSASDKPVMQHAADTLTGLGVDCEMRVLSAHRTPEALRDWVIESETRGARVFIAGAGAAAHLPGVVASITMRPVIGVPLIAANSVANGLDALLSIVQMPRGIPVATVALGEAGAANAGILAAQILAVGDEALAGRVRMLREGMAAKVLANS
jgi:5-(carboxyamino)imidazole ribonucleotide mutase